MGDDSKAVFNLNYEDMDILEMYNSKNDINSLLLKITEGQKSDFDQNQQKPWKSDFCEQLQTKVLMKLEFAIHLIV